MSLDLALFLALVLAFGVALYVMMDGFDLGIGILFPFAPSDRDRDVMMSSVAPIWDGNETWLVLGGTLMIGAFPVAYATLMPAFYVPLMVMLFALIFRGLAFEFRFRATRFRRLWDWSFAGGSALAGFCQGTVLGGFIDGIAIREGIFAGTTFGFLSPFGIACGLGVMAGYTLLGATWLIFKTAGTTLAFGRRAARPALLLTLAFVALVSLWTPIAHAEIAQRWFGRPDILFLWPVPLLTTLVAWTIWRSVPDGRDAVPFLASILLFLLALAGLGVSIFPYAVPRSVTIWQAAASPPTLVFLSIGIAVILPITLAYHAYAHWVFRGKTGSGTGYGGREEKPN